MPDLVTIAEAALALRVSVRTVEREARDGRLALVRVRDLLGHSSLSVTNRYAHLAPAHLVQAVGALPVLKVGKGRGKPAV